MRTMINLLLVIASFIILYVFAPFVIVVRSLNKALRDNNTLDDYLYSVALGNDYTGCRILYGVINHTISSETYRRSILPLSKYRYTLFVKIINLLFWDKNHCKKAYKDEFTQKNI